jgi:regulatory protein
LATITKIETQKKNKERVNIYLDNKFYKGIFAEIAYNKNLYEGMEIDKEELDLILKEEEVSKAKEKALQILNGRHQSENSLREKLYKREYDKIVVDQVINYLKECNLINDEELAESLADTCLNVKKYGRRRIKDYLYKNKIKKSIIDNVFYSIDKEIEEENAIELAKDKIRTKDTKDTNKLHQKLYRYLAYRGYEYDVIKKAIDSAL